LLNFFIISLLSSIIALLSAIIALLSSIIALLSAVIDLLSAVIDLFSKYFITSSKPCHLKFQLTICIDDCGEISHIIFA
jgi:uncharacterized membrane protein YfhO